jgi:hypothetical protein
MSRRTQPPPAPARAAPRLAHAFLALGDDRAEPEAARRPAVVAAASVAAAVALAISAPLTWATAARPKLDQPPATPASKAALLAPDDDAPDGGA